MAVQWLGWQWGMVLAAAFGTAHYGLAARSSAGARSTSGFLREAAIVAFLYAVWRIACGISFSTGGGAYARGRTIERIDRLIPFDEHAMQQLVLGHPSLVRLSNLYYAGEHFVTLAAFLVWLFVRHRDGYARARTVLAWSTLLCLLIQLVPVAPPRLLPGYVDTGELYHQSVYSAIASVDELSAMPSIHVLWAAVVALGVWRSVAGRWRWLGLAHLTAVLFCVVVTANHWWLDGIVAFAILAVIDALYGFVSSRRVRSRAPRSGTARAVPLPDPVH